MNEKQEETICCNDKPTCKDCSGYVTLDGRAVCVVSFKPAVENDEACADFCLR